MTTQQIIYNQIYVDIFNLFEDIELSLIEEKDIKIKLDFILRKAVRIENKELENLVLKAYNSEDNLDFRLKDILYYFERKDEEIKKAKELLEKENYEN